MTLVSQLRERDASERRHRCGRLADAPAPTWSALAWWYHSRYQSHAGAHDAAADETAHRPKVREVTGQGSAGLGGGITTARGRAARLLAFLTQEA
jgi:hypothetical protein